VARRCAESANGRIDLLLTDVVMPRESGRELAEAMRGRLPELAVVFMSGYTPDVVLRQGVEQDSVPYIAKPFTDEALAETVRRALDDRKPPG
jgi:FixJ family two-component response regulator